MNELIPNSFLPFAFSSYLPSRVHWGKECLRNGTPALCLDDKCYHVWNNGLLFSFVFVLTSCSTSKFFFSRHVFISPPQCLAQCLYHRRCLSFGLNELLSLLLFPLTILSPNNYRSLFPLKYFLKLCFILPFALHPHYHDNISSP